MHKKGIKCAFKTLTFVLSVPLWLGIENFIYICSSETLLSCHVISPQISCSLVRLSQGAVLATGCVVKIKLQNASDS